MAAVLAFRRSLLTSSNPSRIITTSRHHPLRTLSTTATRKSADGNNDDSERPSMPFKTMPSPPRLPKEEQEVFEQLQKQSTGAFSTHRTPPKVNQSPSVEAAAQADESTKSPGESGEKEEVQLFHRDYKGTLSPEFEGEKNPKTGELGGPKNEPLRWGAEGDWSYGGRVTDF